MEKYQLPSLSMIPLYRNEMDPTRTVMDWKQTGAIIEQEILRDGFNVRVFPLEDRPEKIVFGIIISEDRFSLNYYKEMFERNIQNLSETDNWKLSEAPDGSRAFMLELNKDEITSLELRTALESREILSSPSRLTIPVGRAFTDTVECVDLRFFSCLYLQDYVDYIPGLADIFMTGLLFRTTPGDVRFLILDSAHLLEVYYGLPHMFEPAILTEDGTKEALKWLSVEIIDRLNAMENRGSKSLDGYNASLRVDEFAYTRLLVLISNTNKLMEDPDFTAVLRLVREHGIMVGIHFFLFVSEPVPSTYITKSTITIKRAIDSESPTKRTVKRYQVRRGEHTPHFLDCCYTEQSDIDTIVKYLKENNEVRYAHLMKIVEKEAEDAAAQEQAALSAAEPEKENEDVLVFSFDEAGANQKESDSGTADENERDPLVETANAAKWQPAIHIPNLDEHTPVSRVPLQVKSRRHITGCRTTIAKNPGPGARRMPLRARKTAHHPKPGIMSGFDTESVPEVRETPISAATVSKTEMRKDTNAAAGSVLSATGASKAETSRSGRLKEPEAANNVPTGAAKTERRTSKRKSIVLPALLGAALVLGGTYTILRQNNVISPLTSYLPESIRASVPFLHPAEQEIIPAPTATVKPTLAPTAPVETTAVPVATPVIQKSLVDNEPVSTTAPATSQKPSETASSQRTDVPAGATPTPEIVMNGPHGMRVSAEPVASTEAQQTSAPAVTAEATVIPTAAPESESPMTTAAATSPAPTETSRAKLVRATDTPSPVPTATSTAKLTEATEAPSAEPTATAAAKLVRTTEAPSPEPAGTPDAKENEVTAAPSAAPTATTAAKLVRATAVPTQEPTATPEPTAAPTAAPTEAPTAAPTAVPTEAPTATSAAKLTRATATPAVLSTEVPVTETAEPAETDGTAESIQERPVGQKAVPVAPIGLMPETTDVQESDTENEAEEKEMPAAGLTESNEDESSSGDADSAISLLNEHYAQGDKGPDIIRIKQRLSEMGYYDQTTGFSDTYNKYMTKLVTEFQLNNSLPETGEIGPEELALMFKTGK